MDGEDPTQQPKMPAEGDDAADAAGADDTAGVGDVAAGGDAAGEGQDMGAGGGMPEEEKPADPSTDPNAPAA